MGKYYLDEINNIERVLNRDVLIIDGKKSISDIFIEIKKDKRSEAIIVKNKNVDGKVLIDDVIGLVNLQVLRKSQVYCTNSEEKIEKIALRDFCTINSFETIRKAKLLMKAKSRDKLVVIEARKVIGIVTILDILKDQDFDEEDMEIQARVALDNVDEAICVVNRDGIVTFWNKNAERLYGHKREDIKGKKIFEFFPNTSITRCLQEESLCLSFKDKLEGNSHMTMDGMPLRYKGKLIGAIAKSSNKPHMEDISNELNRKRLKVEELRKEMDEIIEDRYGFDRIKSKSKILTNAIRLAKSISPSDIPILINGEIGTGKSLFAKAIHKESNRKGKFIAINCSLVLTDLLEEKLFGAFELANQGTLFLDEIGNLPISTQQKLAKVLKSGIVEKLDTKEPIKFDTRIIGSTSKELGDMIKSGEFNEELYFELNTALITIPPLRDRKEDIPDLIETFMCEFSLKNNMANIQITPEAIDMLIDYPWEGNEMQLKNIVERFVILSQGKIVDVDSIPFDVVNHTSEITDIRSRDDLKKIYDLNLKDAVENFEKEIIKNTLIATGGNKSKAAKILKVKRSTLHYKLNLYNLTEY